MENSDGVIRKSCSPPHSDEFIYSLQGSSFPEEMLPGTCDEGLDLQEDIGLAGHGRQVPIFSWTPAYEVTFFRSLIESVHLGLRENGTFKAETWERASQALQEHHGVSPDKSLLIEKNDDSRERFQLWRGLREDPDFIYNSVSRTVTTTEEAWRAHIEREPLSRAFKGRPFDHEEYMEALYPELVNAPLRDDSAMPGTSILNPPVEIIKLQVEETFQKLKQMKEQGVPPNDPEHKKASDFSPNFQQQRNLRRNQHQDLQSQQQTQQICQDAQDARGDLTVTNAIAEPETTDNPSRSMEENYRMRQERYDTESEITVLKEMFRVLVDESQAEFKQAAEGTEVELEAQALAQTLAQQTTLYMLDVQELKGQFFGAPNMLERNEKGSLLLYKIRSFDFLGMRDMIKEIKNKREAGETREEREAREAWEAREAREARIIRRIADANFELSDHEERKQRVIERREKALETMHADRGQENSSAAPGKLETRHPSTEVSLRTEAFDLELKSYQESISEEEERIRDILEKIEALKEELRLFREEKEVQAPSGSESQKTKSRGSVTTTWQCCQCGTGDLVFHLDYYCTEHNCRHPFCRNCIIKFDRGGPA